MSCERSGGWRIGCHVMRLRWLCLALGLGACAVQPQASPAAPTGGSECPFLPEFLQLEPTLAGLSPAEAAAQWDRYMASHENPEACEAAEVKERPGPIERVARKPPRAAPTFPKVAPRREIDRWKAPWPTTVQRRNNARAPPPRRGPAQRRSPGASVTNDVLEPIGLGEVALVAHDQEQVTLASTRVLDDGG